MEPRGNKPMNDKSLNDERPLRRNDISLADVSLADELRNRLTPKMPSADFTARIMARVREQSPLDSITRPARNGLSAIFSNVFPRPRWALAGALATALAAVVFVAQDGLVRKPPGSEAEAQLFLSLQLAGEKFNKARDAVLRPPRKNARLENER